MISFGLKRVSSLSTRASLCRNFRAVAIFHSHQINLRAFSVDPRGPSSSDEAAAKQAARQFMGAVKEESSITEIASYDEWRIKVMEELNKPIILDCYADWCQPCKKLTPVLEQITQQHEGKFKLVKLNIDNLPQLAQGLNVKNIPALFLIYRGNIMDTMVGADMNKMQELINTALLIEQSTHDESVMQKVLDEAQKLIEKKQYEKAEQILRDGLTYEQWRDKFGAQCIIGIAHCQLMRFADPAKARETLSPLTEAQVKDMPDNTYWSELVFKVDEEIQRLETLAQPDDSEMAARSQIEKDPKNLNGYNDLANILIQKNRLEEAIQVILDMLTIERNWTKEGEKKPQERLIEVFAKLGQTNETVKKAKKRLAKILF